jgi:hypothetical protein
MNSRIHGREGVIITGPVTRNESDEVISCRIPLYPFPSGDDSWLVPR